MRIVVTAFRECSARLRGRAFSVALAVALALVVVVAVLERRDGPIAAADRTLGGAILAWAVPLLAYVTTSVVARRGRLDDALSVLVRHGASLRSAVLGATIAAAAWAALAGAVVAAIGVQVAAPHLDASALRDAFASSWIAALGGLTYAAMFSLGSLVGARGRGRAALLVADFLVGSGHGAVAALFPRPHLGSLAGGALTLELSQRGSSLALGALAVVFLVAALLRSR